MSSTTNPAPLAGAPFAAMLRGALVPSLVAGVLAVVGVTLWRGGSALGGALVGLVVSVTFFAIGYLMLSRLVRSASPQAFLAVAMAIYLGQVILLLVVILGLGKADWVDGPALAVVALVVTLVWQVGAMAGLRRSRVPMYDDVRLPHEVAAEHPAEPSTAPGERR